MKKALPIILLAALVIIVGGIYFASRHNTSTNSSANSQSMNNMPANNSPTQSTQSPTATNAVAISNFAFSPNTITVKKGTTVTWTNKDTTTHTVVEFDGQTGPKSQDLGQGQTYSFTFDSVGTYTYKCSIHPSMTGKVTVTE